MTTKLEYNATDYSKFRPRVPQKVMDVVLDFLRAKISSDKWQIAVDVGCGNGQGSNLLAKYFDKVYGFDISDGQIEEANAAKTSDNVVYAVSESNPINLNTYLSKSTDRSVERKSFRTLMTRAFNW